MFGRSVLQPPWSSGQREEISFASASERFPERANGRLQHYFPQPIQPKRSKTGLPPLFAARASLI
jgi:hypothetical protein